jgi:hypothetical protein
MPVSRLALTHDRSNEMIVKLHDDCGQYRESRRRTLKKSQVPAMRERDC